MQLVQDGLQIQIKAKVTIVDMNILFVMKVKFLVLIK